MWFEVKKGSKYYPLYQYLEQSGEQEVTLTFAAVESLLNSPLPASARKQRGWWSNRDTSVWLSAGYDVVDLDLKEERVVFRHRSSSYRISYQGNTPVWNADSIRALRHYMDLTQEQMAETLGVRQQTISEWETNVYSPSRATTKYLTLVAERAGFLYNADSDDADSDDADSYTEPPPE